MDNSKALPRLRTLDKAYNEIRDLDPHTDISKHFLRVLGIDGSIKTVMCGKKRLFDMDSVYKYFGYTA